MTVKAPNMHPSLVSAKPGDFVWCCHHELIVETLTEPPESRSAYIDRYKPEREQSVRHAAFRRVLHPERLPAPVLAAMEKFDAASEKHTAAGEKYIAMENCTTELVAQFRSEWPDAAALVDEKGHLVFEGAGA